MATNERINKDFISFELHLKEILEKKFGIKINHIIPEFPILCYIDEPWRVFQIDYLAIPKEKNTVYFVELNTNIGSRNGKRDSISQSIKDNFSLSSTVSKRKNLTQDIFFSTVSEKRNLVQNIIDRQAEAEAKQREKYNYFLSKLEKAGLVKKIKNKNWEVISSDYDVEVICIQSNESSNYKTIRFSDIRKYLKHHTDDFTRRFCESLEESDPLYCAAATTLDLGLFEDGFPEDEKIAEIAEEFGIDTGDLEDRIYEILSTDGD